MSDENDGELKRYELNEMQNDSVVSHRQLTRGPTI